MQKLYNEKLNPSFKHSDKDAEYDHQKGLPARVLILHTEVYLRKTKED